MILNNELILILKQMIAYNKTLLELLKAEEHDCRIFWDRNCYACAEIKDLEDFVKLGEKYLDNNDKEINDMFDNLQKIS